MFLRTALIFCEEPKTDDELKAIMATHPWAPALMHGFRIIRGGTWEDERYSGSLRDSIYIDVGYGMSHDEKWLVKNFHDPSCALRVLEDLSKEEKLQEDWWQATTILLLNSIPEDYPSHVVYYGEIEDEFEPGQAEEAWKREVLEACDYDPKVIAEFESAA